MIRSAQLRSLAKINLDLRVLERRSDGYHELRTVFQTISLADRVGIDYQPARRTRITIEDSEKIPDNLVVRAAAEILDRMRVHARVHFRLHKRIPMGAGLGGGSSNAAAVLLALPVLAGRQLGLAELMEIGATLGSDVPFFLLGGTALGLGTGTELYPLQDVRQEPLLVVSPGLHVSTAGAYRAVGRGLTVANRLSRLRSFRGFVRTLAETRSAAQSGSLSSNDFEPVVFRQHPQLETILKHLQAHGARGVRMTGSGSAMVAVFESRLSRQQAERGLKREPGLDQCRIVPASLVNQRSYRRLWRRQLADHIRSEQTRWPPPSRYARSRSER